MNIQGKINHLKHFLNLALQSQDSSRARQSLAVAHDLLQEVETATLANPFLQDEDLAFMVSLTRSPLWTQADHHILALQKSEKFQPLAA